MRERRRRRRSRRRRRASAAGRAPARAARRGASAAAAASPPATPTRRRPPSRRELAARPSRTTPSSLRRELDHPDHQRDPDRVVGAGLALEDRARAAARPRGCRARRTSRPGRSARAPRRARPAVVQREVEAAQWAASATSPAVANVPSTPSESDRARRRCGSARQPISMPPSKRITISATTPIRSTSRIESASCRAREEVGGDRRGDEEERRAGIASRSVSSRSSRARARSPPATTSTIVPKVAISSMRRKCTNASGVG